MESHPTDGSVLAEGEIAPADTTASCPTEPVITAGCCYAIFAYDVGASIDLDAAERHIQHTTQRESIRHRRRAPRYFEYRPAPLRITVPAQPIALGDAATEARVDLVLYDFGAVSVTYRIALGGALSRLPGLSDALYDNEALHEDSRRRAEELVSVIGPSVVRPRVADAVEDYVIYHLAATAPALAGVDWRSKFGPVIAQVLRTGAGRLAAETVEDVWSCRVSFATDDLVVIDWNAALVADPDAEDVLAVLEYVNVELMEMRYLDDQLDEALDRAYALFSRRSWNPLRVLRARGADLKLVAELQLDSAVMFEGVNNALKLVGDQYLARVYHLAVQRLHLDDWDTNILRKLGTLESIYQKLADRQAARRLEVLEWIIILLIAASILISL